jgi:adenylate kinase family enzyme
VPAPRRSPPADAHSLGAGRSRIMRVLVFGNSGSGKTTLARSLAVQHRLLHLDLDSIVWEPGQIAVQRPADAIAASLRQFLSDHDTWVIEGCYGELIEVASAQCTELIFLNPGLAACLANNRRRLWEPHKYASIEQQDAMLEALQAWVADYYTRTGPWSYEAHRLIFDRHNGTKVEHVDLQSAPCTSELRSTSSRWTGT